MSLSTRFLDIAVPSGGPTVSATIDLAPNEAIVGIQLSATFDGTALTVTGNANGSSTLVPVKDCYGNAVSLTIADDTANYYMWDPLWTIGLLKAAITSGTAQGAAETVRVAIGAGF